MKKVLMVVMVLLFALSVVVNVSLAEETESEFEKVLLSKGTLMMKEITTYKTVKNPDGYNEVIDIEVATLTDVETGEKVSALRLNFQCFTGYDFTETAGVLDIDEVDSAITTLEYVKTQLASGMKDYTEIIYTANSGLKIGAYSEGNTQKLFVSTTTGTLYTDTKVIDDFVSALKGAQAELEKL